MIGTGSPGRVDAASPLYWLGTNRCLAACYREDPEPFTAAFFAYYRQEDGQLSPVENLPLAVTWKQTNSAGTLVGQQELDLETGSTGQASDTQNLLTSLNTALVYSLPWRAGSYEFVGFSFLLGQGCDPPPDWGAWERAENSLEVSAASPLQTQGGRGVCRRQPGGLF